MNKLACVILDYKRPDNMPLILEAVGKQDIEVDTYVVHQENRREYECTENIWLGANRGPGARCMLLPMIPNEYAIFIDDDLKPTDPSIFRVMLDHAIRLDTHVGAYGVRLAKGSEKPYSKGVRVFHQAAPLAVDVLLGNFQMVRTREASALWNSNLQLVYDLQEEAGFFTEFDDIIMSWLYSNAGKTNFVAGTGVKPYRELDLAGGLEFRDNHIPLRDMVAGRLFGNGKVQ